MRDDEEILQLPGYGSATSLIGLLQFSPDGRFLDDIDRPQGFRSHLRDLSAPKPKRVLDDDHNCLAFRPDSREVAASYPDWTVRFFDTESGRELRRFRIDPHSGSIHSLYWHPKLPQLLVNHTHLLNVNTGAAEIVDLKIADHVSAAAWHPEGRLLAACGVDNKIYLWGMPNAHLALPPLEGHTENSIAVHFDHAGDRLLSSDASENGHLWDVRTGRLLLTIPGILRQHSYFSPDDRLMAAVTNKKIRLYHFRRGEELITVIHRNTKGQAKKFEIASCLDAQGRCLAIAAEDGVALVDVARGEEATLLPLPGNAPLCFEAEGALWTHGNQGLLRWPVTIDRQTGQRRYGPPKRYLGGTRGDVYGSNADIGVLAVPLTYEGTVVFNRDPQRVLHVGPKEYVRSCAVSPDGRWVVLGNRAICDGVEAQIWDARDGRHIKDLPTGFFCLVQFSPDGKWLLTTANGGSKLWDTETWQQGPSLGGTPWNAPGAFSRDGKLLALGDEPGIVRLVAPDTGKEIARLTVPGQARLAPCCFTPDGTKLIVVGAETTDLYILDLRAIRAGLAELELDWDAPLLPPAPQVTDAAPLSIHFELGDDVRQWTKAQALLQKAYPHLHAKEYAKALTLLRQAVEIAPSFAKVRNDLAWLLLTGPKELRDPEQALLLARRAAELRPEENFYHNTLGIALYRNGKFAEAVPVLEHSLRENQGYLASFDLFFLAMCHHRLGDTTKAKDYYERARQWFQERKGRLPEVWVEELTAFQAEADAVLAQPPGRTTN